MNFPYKTHFLFWTDFQYVPMFTVIFVFVFHVFESMKGFFVYIIRSTSLYEIIVLPQDLMNSVWNFSKYFI